MIVNWIAKVILPTGTRDIDSFISKAEDGAVIDTNRVLLRTIPEGWYFHSIYGAIAYADHETLSVTYEITIVDETASELETTVHVVTVPPFNGLPEREGTVVHEESYEHEVPPPSPGVPPPVPPVPPPPPITPPPPPPAPITKVSLELQRGPVRPPVRGVHPPRPDRRTLAMFLSKWGDEITEWAYEVPLDEGMDVEGLEEPWRSVWMQLTRHRIDFVFVRRGVLYVSEIKPRLSLTAIGQAIVAATMVSQRYQTDNFVDLRPAVICDTGSPLLLQAAASHRVVVYLTVGLDGMYQPTVIHL